MAFIVSFTLLIFFSGSSLARVLAGPSLSPLPKEREQGLLDQNFIDKHLRFSAGDHDVDQAAFQQFLRAYAPEKVEQELGVSATVIRHVAYAFAKSRLAKPAATWKFWWTWRIALAMANSSLPVRRRRLGRVAGGLLAQSLQFQRHD